MPSAGTWPGTCSAWKEALQDVDEKYQIFNGGEKVKKKRSGFRNACDVYKVEVHHMVGSVPADCWPLVTEAFLASPELKVPLIDQEILNWK